MLEKRNTPETTRRLQRADIGFACVWEYRQTVARAVLCTGVGDYATAKKCARRSARRSTLSRQNEKFLFGQSRKFRFERHGGTQRGALDVGTSPGSAESLACREPAEPATCHPSASRPRAGGEQPMGTGAAATDETGGRWWGGAPVTGTTLEPQTAPDAETARDRSVQ